jgi:molybdopterin-containing oxidoreductase family iron-sulfur binding subunit
MSMDQCHSTVGELSTKKPRVSHAGVGVTGRKYWRSLDDLADTPAFREFLEREFPNNASRLLDSSRRTFLKLMGASVALAGAATLPGCRRPDHKILPYSKSVPEEIIPGKPLYYATTLPLPGGEVEGVLVETHEGRPTKIEGNPLHPINNGKSTLWSQASILSLYDPDRLKDPVYTREGTTARSWADFDAWGSKHFAGLGVKQGEGLCFLVEKRLSPSRDAVKTALLKKFPKAKWLSYDPLQADEMFAGLAAAVGQPCRELFRLENADVVVSFDRDFLGLEAGQLVNTRGFASRRRAESGSMSRLYSIESAYSITGGRADHRLRLSPALVTMAVVALAKELVAQGAAKMTPALSAAIGAINIPSVGKALDMAFIVEVAKDLAADEQGRSRAGKTLVCAGASQPRAVHALVAALNASMGNVGKTVDYVAVPAEFGASSAAALSELAADLDAGKVDTLVCVGVNPAYDAPGELGLAKKLEKAAHRIVASVETTETSEMAHWRLPMSHWLEAWGDTVALDGTVGAIQPMIAPLYGTRSDIEILGGIAGVGTDGHEIVRGAWRDVLKMGDLAGFERTWKRALHDGVGQRGAPLPSTVGAAMGDNAARMVSGLRLEAPRDDEFEVVVIAGNAGDGRFANNPWLQEIPDATNKIVWDNVAMISRATAEKFGLEQEKETLEVRHARMMTVSVGGRSIDIAAWLTPGIPDNTIVIAAGYGRTACGLVGTGVGFGVHGLLGAGNLRRVGGAKIARAGGGAEKYPITCTQAHGSMEGRAIVREADFEAWKTFGEDPFHGFSQEEKDRVLKDPYGNARAITFGNNEGRLNFAEMLGELSHAPANVNAYMNPQRGTKDQGAAAVGVHGSASTGKPAQPNTAVDFSKGPQWGMTIDLSTCTGCNACTIACQAENNIAVVGKREANKHREMHWIRVDRYFAGDVDSPGVMYQPVLCVQCENAPCETVCPVNATVHGPEGINYMVYNRCIGTRYCANNCPYKVRRFNFFEYGTKKFNGSYIGKESLNEMGVEGPKNPNLVPPRLRQQIDNISKLQKNPDVTVRSRGVMEKCTFCVQRLNEARIEMKLQNLRHIPDGFVQVACQQACPSDAIVFGDILDTKSRVSKERGTARAYMLLGYLNTRPRVLHLMGVRNPNPKLCDPQRVASWSHPYHHGGHEEDHDAGHGGGEHGAASHGSAARNLFDPAKRLEDAGYRLSLAVLAT